MFICGFCKQSSLPGERLTKVPVETRQKHYQSKTAGHPGYVGSEIVIEEPKCPGCLGTRVIAPPAPLEAKAS